MADFYATTSKSIHFPAEVGDVSTAEIVHVLEEDFQYVDPTQKKSVEILVSGL